MDVVGSEEVRKQGFGADQGQWAKIYSVRRHEILLLHWAPYAPYPVCSGLKLSDRFSTLWASGTSITYPLFRSSLMVLVYFSLRTSTLSNRFSRDFSCTRKSNYLGAECYLLPTAFRHRSQAIVYRRILEDFVSPCVCCRSWVDLPVCPRNDSMSYHDFTWLANSLSCSIFTLKHVEVKQKLDGNGPLKTQPMGKRTATGERFSSAEKYSNGRMAW